MSKIKSDDSDITIDASGSGRDIKFQANGVEKASISSAGAFTSTTIDATKLTGNLPAISGANLTGISSVGGATGVDFNDNVKARFGTGNDLQIFHDASNSYIENTGTGDLIIQDSGGDVRIKGKSNEDSIVANNDGSVDLYYDNSKKFETTSEGAKVTGHLRLNNSQEVQLGGSATHIEGDSGYMAFDVGSTERMRIDSSGALLIGATSRASTEKQRIAIAGNAENGIRINSNTTNTSTAIQLANDANGVVGSITTSGSSTAYNTSSDYRLKENVDYTWDATTRLKQLKPARFNFIADDTNTLVDGFIAHEVSSVVPEAVSGEKDAMTSVVLYAEGDELPEGKNVGDVKTAAAIDPQGIDQSKLVPLLVKTIQELEARITALEA